MEAKGILFDADGVLIDACELHYVALNRALAHKGWSISPVEHEAFYNALTTRQKLERLSLNAGFPREWHGQIYTLKQHYTKEAIEECLAADPAIREILCGLKAQGIRLGVCSNSTHDTLVRMLRRVHLDDLVEVALGNHPSRKPKPAPDVFLLGAELLETPIWQCLIVEDSPVGFQAAEAACPLGVIRVESPQDFALNFMSYLAPHLPHHLTPNTEHRIQEVA